MRYIGFPAALLLTNIGLFAQQYNINTAAGGSPLPNAPAAVNAPIGNPTVMTSDASGNLYFVSDDCVFQIAASGALTRVAGNSRVGYFGDGGPATQAQLANPQGLAVDSTGNLYIADTGNSRIRKVVLSTGIIYTIAGTATIGYSPAPQPASSAALSSPQGLAVDSSGNVYVADTGNNVVRLITASTGAISTVAGNNTVGSGGDQLPATAAQLNAPTGVALDSSNNLYIADSKNNRVREVTSGIMSTIAGNGLPGFSGDNNLATAAQLNLPTVVIVAPNSVIYVLDAGNNRVRQILPNKVISTVAGIGGSIPANSPTGIATDTSSDLFVADASHVVFKDTVAGAITVYAGNSAVNYALGDSGPATSAQLVQPEGLAVDTSGNIYVADAGEARIRRFTNGSNIASPAGATAIAPAGVAVDSLSNIYIADAKGNFVYKVSSAGVSSVIAGTGAATYGGDNLLATAAQLTRPGGGARRPPGLRPPRDSVGQPCGVALDASGNIYIADTGNNRIRKIAVVTGIITTIAGNSSAGYQGDNLPAVNAVLNQPTAVAVDASGNVFIADTGNNRIREISANTAIITTVAGNGAATSSGDGAAATSAGIVLPHGVTVDVHGNLYITDWSGRVRKVSITGLITTIAGNGTQGYFGDGGAATSAQLDTPWGIAVDSGGNVYVSDPGEQAVRILTPVAASPLSVLTTSPLPAGTVGMAYAQALSATGGTPPYAWSIAVGSLPAGLTLSPSGSITGIPTNFGTFLVVFQVTDSASITAQATIEIVINSSNPTGLTITTSPVLVPGGVNLPYSQGLTAAAGSPPYAWALISGSLPAGLTLSPAGVITGIPTASGNASFTVRVSDTTGAIATQTFTLPVIAFATPTRTGVLAHYAAGGPWTTRAYLTNVSNAPVEVNLVVHTDDGSILPFTLTQQGATQQVGGNSFLGVMNPNTTIVINTGAGLPNTATGWIDVLTSGAVNPLAGFAVFRLASNGNTSEGTTPLQTTFATSMHLQFDDTTGYDSNVAIANLSANPATVTATAFDPNGNTLGTYTISLGAMGHTAFVVPTQFGVTNNQIGIIQFTNTSGGNLAGVGLRANTVTGTFTTIPMIVP